MESITILVPRIKPPQVPDIITKQLEIIFSRLQKYYNINIVWVTFQPNNFDEYIVKNFQVIDFHKFNDAIEIIEEIKPDLIISESRLGINGIAFAKAGKATKIPIITIIGYIGVSEFFGRLFSMKTSIQLMSSNKVLAGSSFEAKTKKFGMVRYILRKYVFLLKTLRKINYNYFDLIRFIFFYPGIHIFARSYPPLHNITSGDLNMCFNKHLFDRLIEAGFDQSKILLEGDPVFDELYSKISKYTTPKKESTKTSILFCPTPMHEHGWLSKKEEDDLILGIINKIKDNDEFDIALKIHPSTSNYKEYETLLEKTNHKVLLFQKEDTLDLLNQYDLMLTYGSSDVILEAILLNKPVVLFKYDAENKFNRFSDSNIINECNKISELINTIKKATTHTIPQDSLSSYIEKHIGKFDGKNSERTAYAIYHFLKK